MPTVTVNITNFPLHGALDRGIIVPTFTPVLNALSYGVGWNFTPPLSPPSWSERGCFVRFDTSFIGAASTVTSASIIWQITGSSGGEIPIQLWFMELSVGTWIGPTLDGTAADWAAAGSVQQTVLEGAIPPMGVFSANFPPPAAVDLFINKTGFTDVRFLDRSTLNGDPRGLQWWQTFTHNPATYPRLIVNYSEGASGVPGGEQSSRARHTPF